MSLIDRGDIFAGDVPGLGIRPVLVVSRQVAIPVLTSVTVALVTSTVRGIASEVPLYSKHGLSQPSAANCDNLFTISKARLASRIGSLFFEDVKRLDDALRFALELD